MNSVAMIIVYVETLLNYTFLYSVMKLLYYYILSRVLQPHLHSIIIKIYILNLSMSDKRPSYHIRVDGSSPEVGSKIISAIKINGIAIMPSFLRLTDQKDCTKYGHRAQLTTKRK